MCVQTTPERRREYEDYLGGGGFVFESIDEVPGIISQPYPEQMRLLGLENAKKCDIETHKHLLSHVWDSCLITAEQ